MKAYVLLLALGFLAATQSAHAQPAVTKTEAAPAAPSRLAPAVTVSLLPGKIGVLEDFVVQASVSNETTKPIQIRSGRICYPADMLRARSNGAQNLCTPLKCTMKDGQTQTDCNRIPVTVAVGQSHVLLHHDETGWGTLSTPSSWPSLLTWTERKSTLTLELEYSGEDAQIHKVSRELYADVTPSLMALLIGAWFGAVLLAAFSLVHARHRDGSAPEATVAHAGRLLVAGLVTGSAFILLIQRVGDLDLPFKFAVNDVIGGVIVGLLSFKLGDTLHKYFFGR